MEDKVSSMNLPQAVIARLLKEENINTSKEARETMSRATAVFMLHLSGMACQNAKDNNHKTICADDVLRALRALDSDTIFKDCRDAVDDWKVVKQQRSMQKRVPDSQ